MPCESPSTMIEASISSEPGHRVDDEHQRRPQPARAAPDADQEVERDQHRLPEDVEEEQVLGDEDADDRARQQQHQPVVGARPLAAGPERVADRGRQHDHRQPGEPEREAVEADVVGDVQVAEPALSAGRAAGRAWRSRSARPSRSRARPRPARTSSAVEPTANGRSGSSQTSSAPAIGNRISAVASQPLLIAPPRRRR